MPIVYVHTCRVNQKSYVGFTTKTLDERWEEHVKGSETSKLLFALAIRKYGTGDDVWEHRVHSEHATIDEAKEAERNLIALLRSNESKFGYNMTAGGDGCFANAEVRAKMSASQRKRPPMSEETRRKIGDAHRGEKNANFGKKFSEETRRKLSESHKNPSQEVRDKIRKAHLGRKHKPRTEASKERSRKAREGKCTGSDHPMFHGHPRQKLTLEDVIEIKSSDPSITHEELAARYNIRPLSIYAVRLGLTWKHVRPDLTRKPEEFYRWHNGHTVKSK